MKVKIDFEIACIIAKNYSNLDFYNLVKYSPRKKKKYYKKCIFKIINYALKEDLDNLIEKSGF